MRSSTIFLVFIVSLTICGTPAMVQNETCNNSADCLEGLVCVKQICLDAPPVVHKRHSRVFHDRPQSICVLPLVCFP